jgi:hypothetical protein
MLLGSSRGTLEDWPGLGAVAKGTPVRKTIYAITLVLLLALVIQSVWGANLP